MKPKNPKLYKETKSKTAFMLSKTLMKMNMSQGESLILLKVNSNHIIKRLKKLLKLFTMN